MGPSKASGSDEQELRSVQVSIPVLKTDHLLAMCDSTGLLQHAAHAIPDRSHGYCVDDNARALLLACTLGRPGSPRLPEAMTTRFAAFIQLLKSVQGCRCHCYLRLNSEKFRFLLLTNIFTFRREVVS